MESFEVWEMVAILSIVINPWFQSFVEFILEIVIRFFHFFIMKKIDAIIDAFVPLLIYVFQVIIAKTGMKQLRFATVFQARAFIFKTKLFINYKS